MYRLATQAGRLAARTHKTRRGIVGVSTAICVLTPTTLIARIETLIDKCVDIK